MTSSERVDQRTVKAKAGRELAQLERLDRPGVGAFNVRMRIARLGAGLSQSALRWSMRDAGYQWTRKRVYEMESGEKVPNIRELVSLAQIMGCDLTWLLVGDLPPDEPAEAQKRRFLFRK